MYNQYNFSLINLLVEYFFYFNLFRQMKYLPNLTLSFLN